MEGRHRVAGASVAARTSAQQDGGGIHHRICRICSATIEAVILSCRSERGAQILATFEPLLGLLQQGFLPSARAGQGPVLLGIEAA